MILENRTPSSILAWLVVLTFLPYLGVLIYIFLGINWKKSKEKIAPKVPEDIIKNYLSIYLKEQEKTIAKRTDKEQNATIQNLMNLAINTAYAPITAHNEVQIFHEGSLLFDAVIEDLKKAQRSIHMEYFIWCSDVLGERIKEVLIERAKSGVEVRLVFDGLGSFGRISKKYREELRQSGVKILYFHDPFSIRWVRFVNYRNHRKIIVIDGCISYIGGMNVGQEYIDGGKNFPSWKDTHIKIIGQSCNLIQNIFICDWYNAGGRDLNEFFDKIAHFKDISLSNQNTILQAQISQDTLNSLFPTTQTKGYLPMQIITSGPDSTWDNIQKMYVRMINIAKRHIYIQSPYFVPDEEILCALANTALSGVKVHLMITGIPDKRIAWWVAQTYFESLLNAGVQIYLYDKGFLHSKVCCIDDEVACVGTCNMDIRSFYLHYEINAVLYDSQSAMNFRCEFEKSIDFSHKITLQEYTKQHIFIKLRNSLCRLVAPIL